MEFPKIKNWQGAELKLAAINNIQKLEKMVFENPYKIYSIMDEKIEKQEPTTFLVVYVSSGTNYILLVDQTNQVNSTISLEGEAVKNGYYEFIDVGVIERFPLAFYVKS